MKPERVLTRRELNRAVQARQLLLERARLPLPRALERVGGLQSQYAPSMYVGLWSRLEDLTRDQLTRVLLRRLVAGPLRRTELEPIVGKPRVAGVGLWLDLIRVPPSGTWDQRRADLYAAAQDWLGPAAVTAERGVEHLVRRYLGAFGPASRASIAD